MSKSPLHLPDLLARIDTVSEKVREAFGGLDTQQLNLRPEPGAWSVAQVLDHLIVINESYYPLVEKLRAGALHLSWATRWTFYVQRMGGLLLRSVDPARLRKMKTFPIWEPSTDSLPGDIVHTFLAHQEAFKSFLTACQDLLHQNALIHSPANRLVVYSLADAFRILVTHEERHLVQALEVLEQLRMQERS
jgi:uncharacterized damage-inducible protein DinB